MKVGTVILILICATVAYWVYAFIKYKKAKQKKAEKEEGGEE